MKNFSFISRRIILPFYFSFICFVNISYAASEVDEEISVLHEQLNKANQDSTRLSIILEISNYYLYNDLDSSFIYAKMAYKLSKSIEYKIEKAAVLLGNVYCMLDDYVSSNKYLFEAYDIARKTGNTKQYASIFNSLGTNYLVIGDYENGKKYITLAYENSYNYKSKIATTLNLGQVYMHLDDSSKVNEYFEKALGLAIKENNQNDIAKMYNRLGDFYFYYGNHSKGLLYYNKCLKMNSSNSYINMVNIHCISTTYLYLGMFNEGIKTALKADSIAEAEDFLDKRIETCFNLSCLYDSINKPDLALEYFRKHSALKDSIFNTEKAKQINFLNIKFETAQKEFQIADLEKEAKFRRLLSILYIVVGFLISSILFYMLRSYRQKNKILSLEKERISQQQEKEKLEKKRLKLELLEKDREILTNVLQISQQKEDFTNVRSEIEKILSKDNSDKVLDSFQELNTIITAKIKLSDDWEHIKIHFEKVHPDFFSRLKSEFQGLTQNDLKLCAYSKLRFSSKEISRLLNINPRSVQVSRYRLKKKMNIPEDINFDDFIEERL